jgi:hypothetical protein
VHKGALVGLAVVAALAGRLTPAHAQEDAARVELWTFGRGDEVWSKFGHAALCIYVDWAPEGRCYNYGTGDFDNPVQLMTTFLRGRAIFWVSTQSAGGMKRFYQEQDRTIYVQRLPLSPERAEEMVDRLEHDVQPENREYVYHHYYDNCTTRVRDHIDVVTDGALSAGSNRPYGPIWRDMLRDGFESDLGLIMLEELLIGRFDEGRPTLWEAMYSPDVLRDTVERRLGAKPVVIYARQGKEIHERPDRGRRAIAELAWLVAALCGGLAVTGRRIPRRVGLVLAGLVLGLVGLTVDVMAVASVYADLRWNEVMLVLVPTDFLLFGLGGRRLARYLEARLAGLAVVILLAAVGLLVQPLAPAVVLAGLPLLALRVATGAGD